ncbi:MAG TPA: DUF664 domain-containing protein [Candidatus Limnocylindria bacterium]|nr:DUF664 domain-containing protein [Candidatus Limnocylindria bacterium]
MSPKPRRDLEEMRDRLLREIERVLDSTDGLSAEQLRWTPTAKDANSLLVLAAHTVGAAERHVVVNVGGGRPSGTRDEEFAAKRDIAAVRARWAELRPAIVSIIEELPPGRLDDEIPGPNGSHTVRWFLMHAIAHAAEHAGQAELTRDLVDLTD